VFREAAPVIPLIGYVLAVIAGADPSDPSLFVAVMICEIAGIGLYVFEIHDRFVHRGGRRR
jgi:hypothetical protein